MIFVVLLRAGWELYGCILYHGYCHVFTIQSSGMVTHALNYKVAWFYSSMNRGSTSTVIIVILTGDCKNHPYTIFFTVPQF